MDTYLFINPGSGCIAFYTHTHAHTQVLLFIPLDGLQWLIRVILTALQLRQANPPQEQVDYEVEDPLDEQTTRAQVLWMKSLIRLRTQVCEGVSHVGHVLYICMVCIKVECSECEGAIPVE